MVCFFAIDKEIAQKRFIAAGTVHRHTRNVYQKLSVSSRTAAVVRGYAVRLLH
jgi:ATP/maltotriose-dependent transcriptional regulator MalT